MREVTQNSTTNLSASLK
jgi:hypothetical protein